jgi:hypothetical protein
LTCFWTGSGMGDSSRAAALTLVAMVRSAAADTPWSSSCRCAIFVFERKTERSGCRFGESMPGLHANALQCPHLDKGLGWWGRGGGALTGLARLGKAEFCGRINAGREKSQGSSSAQRDIKMRRFPSRCSVWMPVTRQHLVFCDYTLCWRHHGCVGAVCGP